MVLSLDSTPGGAYGVTRTPPVSDGILTPGLSRCEVPAKKTTRRKAPGKRARKRAPRKPQRTGPRKVTKALKKRVIRLLEGKDKRHPAVTMGMAAERVGVSRQTLYNAMEQDEEFREAVTQAREVTDDRVEAAFFGDAMESGNHMAKKIWLQNRGRWKPDQLQVSGSLEEAIRASMNPDGK